MSGHRITRRSDGVYVPPPEFTASALIRWDNVPGGSREMRVRRARDCITVTFGKGEISLPNIEEAQLLIDMLRDALDWDGGS